MQAQLQVEQPRWSFTFYSLDLGPCDLNSNSSSARAERCSACTCFKARLELNISLYQSRVCAPRGERAGGLVLLPKATHRRT